MTKESVEVRKDAEVISIHVCLRARVKKEKPGMYVSYCPSLDLYSQGETAKEARLNIIEAAELFIETCFDEGTLQDVLRECGFHYAGEKTPRKRKKREGGFTGGRAVKIPAEIPFVAYC
ncbi:MAG: type II toxin-antitoxin system HicB family antitoxin [Gammaproteobacteria bacterium]